MKLVNVGCGEVFHPAWINLDVEPVSSDVLPLDARRPWPFADGEVDVVYHSHLLEHLHLDEAREFLAECYRVLKPGGVLRVVVPDLEGIAQAYLTELERVRCGGEATFYHWTVLELTDQLTRERSGGEMLSFLRSASAHEREQVRKRAGAAVVALADARRDGVARRWPGLPRLWRRLRLEAAFVVVRCLGGVSWARALRAGIFRQSGEIHRRMYDEHALSRLLLEAGFEAPCRRAAGESAIAGFSEYGLESYLGELRKPDSLYLEVIRPTDGHAEARA